MAVDPFNSKHVVVGGIGFGRVSTDLDFGGLYVTRDGGVTWVRETFHLAEQLLVSCGCLRSKEPGSTLRDLHRAGHGQRHLSLDRRRNQLGAA